MNSDEQWRKINKFLKGRSRSEIDAFCIYQWIDRCHYEGWWDAAVALGSFIPPNLINQDYQKRIEYLLAQCRNQINYRNEQFVEIGESNDTQAVPLPKVFIDTAENLGLSLESCGQNRMILKYLDKKLLYLEKINFTTCTFYFIDRSCETLIAQFGRNGFGYLVDSMDETKNNGEERRPRTKISWKDATSLLQTLFTQEYLHEIEEDWAKKVDDSSSSSKWNQLGHRIGSQAAQIDDLLLEGASLASIAACIGSTMGRVKSHLKHLERDKGIGITKTGSMYKMIEENLPKKSLGLKSNSNIRALQLNFWTDFRKFVLENESTIKITKAYPHHYLDVRFGHPQCHICMTINIRSDTVTCELYIPDSKIIYQSLQKNQYQIEHELGQSLQWNELPGKKASRIKLLRDADVTDPKNWNELFKWLNEKAEDFQEIFSKYA